ncbi:unnamed protein product [Alopecurus aequalis]
MPPCRMNSTGYCGVRERPNGTYYAEIHSGDTRLGLDTFRTAHEAALAWDVVAWRLGRPRPGMNFDDVWTRQQAHDLAPSSRLVTEEDKRRTRVRGSVASPSPRRTSTRFPQDVAAECMFYEQRRVERVERRAAKDA